MKKRNESGEIVIIKLDTLPKKLNALREKFFPKPKEADFTDINSELHPVPIHINEEIQEKEIRDAL